MLHLDRISARVGGFRLEEVSLHVPRGEYCCLVGPTGAGKTVLLECITGLHRTEEGTVRIGGLDVTHLPPERRPLGYVPQDYALFPHLSVFDNLAYGLAERRATREELTGRVHEIARLLAIDHLLERAPRTLSGGEAQRTALGRALVLERELLIMDEPFGALDHVTKRQLFGYLRSVHRDLGLTVVHITHDFGEAFGLAGMVAVVLRGRLRQVGSPREVFRSPSSRDVAAFLGIDNLWTLEELRTQGRGFLACLAGLAAPGERRDGLLCVSPDCLHVERPSAARPSGLCGEARLVAAHWRGAVWELDLDAGRPLRARLSGREFEALEATPGDSLAICVPPEDVHRIEG